MVAFLLETAIAVAVSVWGSRFAWWVPLVSFPAIMSLGSFMYSGPMPLTNERRTMDGLIMAVQIGWIIAAAVLCYRGLDAWWGIPVGLVVGWATMGLFAPRRWAAEVSSGR